MHKYPVASVWVNDRVARLQKVLRGMRGTGGDGARDGARDVADPDEFEQLKSFIESFIESIIESCNKAKNSDESINDEMMSSHTMDELNQQWPLDEVTDAKQADSYVCEKLAEGIEAGAIASDLKRKLDHCLEDSVKESLVMRKLHDALHVMVTKGEVHEHGGRVIDAAYLETFFSDWQHRCYASLIQSLFPDAGDFVTQEGTIERERQSLFCTLTGELFHQPVCITHYGNYWGYPRKQGRVISTQNVEHGAVCKSAEVAPLAHSAAPTAAVDEGIKDKAKVCCLPSFQP